MRTHGTLRALLAALALASSAACGKPKIQALKLAAPKESYILYTDARKLFSAEVDSSWQALVDDDRAVPGVLFLAPAPKSSKAPPLRKSISAHFYLQGNPDFSDAQSYVRLQRIPEPRVALSPVVDVQAGSWKAQAFTMDQPYLSSPEAEVVGSSRVEVVVLPLAQGFAVFRYSAPLEESARFDALFQRFISSLKIPA